MNLSGFESPVRNALRRPLASNKSLHVLSLEGIWDFRHHGRREWVSASWVNFLQDYWVCQQCCTECTDCTVNTAIRVSMETRTLKMSLTRMRTHLLLTNDQQSPDPIMMTSSLQTWASVSWPSFRMQFSSWWRMLPSTPSISPATSSRRSRPSSRSTFVWSRVSDKLSRLFYLWRRISAFN